MALSGNKIEVQSGSQSFFYPDITLGDIPRFLISPEFILNSQEWKQFFVILNFRIHYSYQMSLKVNYQSLGNLPLLNLKLQKYYLDRPNIFIKNIEIIGKISVTRLTRAVVKKGAREFILKTKHPLNPKKAINLPSDGNGSSVQKKMWMAIKYYKLEGNSILKTLELPQGLDGSQGHMSVDLFQYVASTADSVVSFNCMSSIGMLLS